MAEFCKQCAKKYGLENDEPCFCEGCGKYVEKSNSIIDSIKELSIIILIVLVVDLLTLVVLYL